jgi:hypothetical protein
VCSSAQVTLRLTLARAGVPKDSFNRNVFWFKLRPFCHFLKQKSVALPQLYGAVTLNRFSMPLALLRITDIKSLMPIKKSLMPIKRFMLPIKKAVMPIKKSLMPIKRFMLPIKKFVMPIKKFALPIRKFVMPIRKFIFCGIWRVLSLNQRRI